MGNNVSAIASAAEKKQVYAQRRRLYAEIRKQMDAENKQKETPDVTTKIAGKSFNLHNPKELTDGITHLVDYTVTGYKEAVLETENRIEHRLQEEHNEAYDKYEKYKKLAEARKLSAVEEGEFKLLERKVTELKANQALEGKYERPSFVERALQTADSLVSYALPLASGALMHSPYYMLTALTAPKSTGSLFGQMAEQMRVKREAERKDKAVIQDQSENVATQPAPETPANPNLQSYRVEKEKREAVAKIPTPFQELYKFTEAVTAQDMASVTDNAIMRSCLLLTMQNAFNPKGALAEQNEQKEQAQWGRGLPGIMAEKAQPAVTLLEKMPETAFKPDGALSDHWLDGLLSALNNTIQIGFPNIAGSLLKPVIEKSDPQIFQSIAT